MYLGTSNTFYTEDYDTESFCNTRYVVDHYKILGRKECPIQVGTTWTICKTHRSVIHVSCVERRRR